MTMRIVARLIANAGLVSAVLAAFGATTPAHAIWCATYASGSTNCGFATQEQCRATVAGIGGFCSGSDSAQSAEPSRKTRKAEPKPKRKEPEREAPAEKRGPPPAAAQPAPAPPAAAPQQPANNFQSAQSLILAGNYDAGIAAMKSLGYDDHPDVANMIGYAYNKLGRLDEARRWYTRALAADPNHLGALSSSGALYLAQGDVEKARAELARVQSVCGGTACREYQALAALIAAKRR